MDRAAWGRPATTDEAQRRASGRRSYNSRRQFAAAYRRLQVVRLLTAYGLYRGVQRRIAAALGVSPATISRDLGVIQPHPCPCCGRVTIPAGDE